MRDAIKIGGMPKLGGLILQSLYQMGMGVAKARHRDPGIEIEIAFGIHIIDISAFTALKSHIRLPIT